MPAGDGAPFPQEGDDNLQGAFGVVDALPPLRRFVLGVVVAIIVVLGVATWLDLSAVARGSILALGVALFVARTTYRARGLRRRLARAVGG